MLLGVPDYCLTPIAKNRVARGGVDHEMIMRHIIPKNPNFMSILMSYPKSVIS
jgi:hypothetical protein